MEIRVREFLPAATAVMALALVAPAPAVADDYPASPVRVIVPYSPGGASDTLSRLVTEFLEPALGQSVAIVNIDGAGGAVGWAEATQARPDGYTITSYSNAMALLEAIGGAAFTHEDFEPVAQIGHVYHTVTASGDGPYENLEDYREAAIERPGEVSLAMGRGTLSQFVAAMVEEAMGVDLNLVNVGGGAEKKAAVLGGHEDAMIEPIVSVLEQHRGGQFRILAVMSPERLSFAPDVPTAREQGADLVTTFTKGFLAPKGTPPERVQALADALEEVVADPAFQERAETANLIIDFQGPEDFAASLDQMREETLRIGAQLGY